MNRQPIFSILTASLNAESTVRNTLISVKNQGELSFEHIVCDGGSRDKTLKILEEFSGTYTLKWLSEKDNGIADALNKGLHLANGRYIIVLQADDVFLRPDTLTSVGAFIKKSNKDIYSFPVFLDHPTQGRKLRKPIRHLWYDRFKFIFPHQGCFVKRKVFDEIGDFNTSFKIAMDYDFFYRALKIRCNVGFGNFPVVLMGGNGIGTNDAFMDRRLWEEREVQKINEDRVLWRLAQLVFRSFYLPYRNLRYRHQ